VLSRETAVGLVYDLKSERDREDDTWVPHASGTWFRSRRLVFGLLALVVVGVLVVLVLYVAPSLLVGPDDDLSTAEKLKAENDVRTTLLQALVGIALLSGAYFTGRSYFSNRESTMRQFELDREGQVTERFTKAIDQLGNRDSLDVRLGGIYALERIARESERDHWPIIEVLTAFVREAPNRMETGVTEAKDTDSGKKPGVDVQAALTVLARRTVDFDGNDQHLDLAEAELRSANLSEANLGGAILSHANLGGADLSQANLEGALLAYANLERALLSEANLGGAYLYYANLRGALLSQANLGGANLTGANVERANLSEANLGDARLSEAKLEEAQLWGADLERADLYKANLRGANLSGAKLEGAVLSQANLEGADLSGANLGDARLSIANLGDARLSGAKLERADLSGANLKRANLSEANLGGALLSQANLEGANLSRASLEGAELETALGLTFEQLKDADTEQTKLPPHIR
jgi:uncharacterized protein YjbI with pentapeptide repeats